MVEDAGEGACRLIIKAAGQVMPIAPECLHILQKELTGCFTEAILQKYVTEIYEIEIR